LLTSCQMERADRSWLEPRGLASPLSRHLRTQVENGAPLLASSSSCQRSAIRSGKRRESIAALVALHPHTAAGVGEERLAVASRFRRARVRPFVYPGLLGPRSTSDTLEPYSRVRPHGRKLQRATDSPEAHCLPGRRSRAEGRGPRMRAIVGRKRHRLPSRDPMQAAARRRVGPAPAAAGRTTASKARRSRGSLRVPAGRTAWTMEVQGGDCASQSARRTRGSSPAHFERSQ
jgi:hypothetical protein